ncbi:putative cinnamoyl-CoA reductase [Hypoxylon sp. FL0890]|nr:putative cinnamoyl-CoA reductase [Hypoxylon sp. FL0890]
MTATIFLTGATGLVGFRILLDALSAGHNVRYAVRSEEKAKIVSSNPRIQALALGDRLSQFITPDFTAKGVFDAALQGVTHIIHTGSPVPMPNCDPNTDVFQPTLKMQEELLSSALKTPSVQRIVITSSSVANTGIMAPQHAVSASTRLPPPSPMPISFDHAYVAYVNAKILAVKFADEFTEKFNPHFSISHVMPGYVFGRNELMLDALSATTRNSSNSLLMMGMLGQEIPEPLHGVYAHIEDVGEVHLRVAFLEPKEGEPKDFGVTTKVNYDNIFDIVEEAFPEQVARGIFKRSKVRTQPVEYDSSETEKLLGRKFKSFESAVVDVAHQYAGFKPEPLT